MKNKIEIIIVMFSMLFFSACQDIITDTPESKLAQENFYTNPLSIEYGIMGCYAGMANVTTDEWRFTENRSDNSFVANTGSGSSNRVDLCDIRFFRTPPSQPLLLGFWYSYFQNIMNVNAVLPSVEKGQTFIPLESQRAQYEGELLFIRAYHYFSLVNLWGDMFKVTKTLDKDEAKKLTRRPVAEIYQDIIIPDLKKAAAQLPSYYSSNDAGRVTKWAAKGILAKAYITLGGVNLDSALVLINDIITNSPHGLLTTGVVVGSKQLSAYASIFDISNEMNKEIIFAVRYKGGTSGIGSNFWSQFAPDGSVNKLLAVGTPAGDNNPTPDLQTLLKADVANTTDSARLNQTYRNYAKNSKTILPYPYKFYDPTITQANQGENDWIVLRFADILLLRAEILAQKTPLNSAAVLADINAVRTRAGSTKTLVTGVLTSKNAALDAVYKERRLELAFEDVRWFDLLRMNTSYGDPDKAITILKTEVFVTSLSIYAGYKPIQTPAEGYYKTSRLLLPIPQQEIDTNNELVIPQNADY